MYDKKVFDKRWSHNCAEKIANHGAYRRKKRWQEHMNTGTNHPPANVRELDDQYELHLAAPGREKGDFKISLIDQTLSVSAEDRADDQTRWRRQEFRPQAFTRRFELNEKVDRSAIAATYEQGVLIVKLPKLEEFETARLNIEIN